MKSMHIKDILICAAGGYVTNEKGELLVIFRRGVWDLPKGKFGRDERPTDAAVREVAEEAGITDISASDITHFFDTYHSYKVDGQWKVKQTHWYKMSTKQTHFVPQKEEGIEEIKFVNPLEFLNSESNIHENIKTLIIIANAG